jgi:hypothetical protein
MHDDIRRHSTKPNLRHTAGSARVSLCVESHIRGNEVSSAGNQYLWSNYPSDVRKWISRHGGLGLQIIYLRAAELATMYPTCGH